MKQKNLRIMLDEDIWRALKKNARAHGTIFSFYVRAVLEAATEETRRVEALKAVRAKKEVS